MLTTAWKYTNHSGTVLFNTVERELTLKSLQWGPENVRETDSTGAQLMHMRVSECFPYCVPGRSSSEL